jgi:HK97 family phage major capsid protein
MSTELHDKRGRLVTEARAALEEIKGNTDESRATELEQRHDAIMADFDATEKLIEREEKLKAIEARAAKAREEARPDQSGEGRGQDEGEKIEYRAAFLELARNGFDVQEVSPEARAVLKAGVVSKLEGRSQTVGTNSAGGFTVPTELANVIDKTMKMWGPMYDEAICNVLTTASGNPIDFPTTDDTGRAVAKHTEAAAMTDDAGEDAVFAKMTLNAFAYDTEWVQISMELLQDSNVDIETFIGELLGERLARRVNVELTTGDGTGDPNGIVTASSAGLTAAAVAAVTFDEVIRLQHSVDPAYRQSPKARFMFNDSTLSALRRLKDGNSAYIWQMGDVRTGVPGTLLGQNYSINQAMVDMATGTKSIIYGDFGKYYVRKVGAPMVGVRREYYWPNIGLAGVVRLDGDLIQTGAVKHIVQA